MTEPMSRDEALACAGRILALAQQEGRSVPTATIEALVSYASELRKGEAPAVKPYWMKVGDDYAVMDIEARKHWHGQLKRFEVRLPGASPRWWDPTAKCWCDESDG